MEQNNGVKVTRHAAVPDADMHPEAGEAYRAPEADLYQTPDAYVLMLNMPGARKDSIRLSMDGGALVVQAPVEALHNDKAVLLCNEIPRTGYYRVFSLGEGVDASRVDARFKNGVLTVNLAKREHLRAREITIRSSM